MHHPVDRIAFHDLSFSSCVVLAGMGNSSIGPHLDINCQIFSHFNDE